MRIYFITCLNPDCLEEDSLTDADEAPEVCQFCGSDDIEVTEDSI